LNAVAWCTVNYGRWCSAMQTTSTELRVACCEASSFSRHIHFAIIIVVGCLIGRPAEEEEADDTIKMWRTTLEGIPRLANIKCNNNIVMENGSQID